MAANNIEFYFRNENPLGISWEEWTVRWWNWIFSIPIVYNPIEYSDLQIQLKGSGSDASKSVANAGQEHPAGEEVVFLAGARSGVVNRTITLPSKKGCFFPIATCECSLAEFPSYTDKQLETCARDGNKVNHMELSINGQELPLTELQKYFVDTKWFDVENIVEGNVFAAAPGKSKAYSIGYWFFLKPLEPGSQFDLGIGQSTEDDETSKTFDCSYVVKYHISVV